MRAESRLASLKATGRERRVGLQILVRQAGDVTVMDLQGRALIGSSNDDLSHELRRVIEGGTRKLLVNLSGVAQVDSSGISTIVRSFVTLRREGGSLRLLKPVGHVYEVLDLTRLIQTIPTYDNEKAALESFR